VHRASATTSLDGFFRAPTSGGATHHQLKRYVEDHQELHDGVARITCGIPREAAENLGQACG
jgi:hypothetical protein